jgi:hypothetical protein
MILTSPGLGFQSRQCAAVMTHSGEMIDPPQMWLEKYRTEV